MLQTYAFSFTIAGSNGSATGNQTSGRQLSGRVVSVYVKYNTQPNTTDVTIATKGDNGPAQTLLTLTNKNTDGLFYPRVAVHDVLGAAATFDGTRAIVEPPVIDDYVTATAAQGNAGTIQAWITVEC